MHMVNDKGEAVYYNYVRKNNKDYWVVQGIGSTVVYGRGKAVITATGMSTEMGKIAGVLSNTKDEQTPLQRKLDELGRLLSKMVLGICVFIFAFNLFMARGELTASGHALEVVLKTFMVAVSLAVAALSLIHI